jgi:hypothetical protein
MSYNDYMPESRKPVALLNPVDAMQYTGANDQKLVEWATGKKIQPYTLPRGFRQHRKGDKPPFTYGLAAPAAFGEVYLYPGDWYCRCQSNTFTRLSNEQLARLYPDLYQRLTKNRT